MLRRDGGGSDQLERLIVETPPGGFIPLLPGCPFSCGILAESSFAITVSPQIVELH